MGEGFYGDDEDLAHHMTDPLRADINRLKIENEQLKREMADMRRMLEAIYDAPGMPGALREMKEFMGK